MPKLLTKSAYIAGQGSKAYLWKYVNDRNSLPIDDSSMSRMDEGSDVGELAKRLYSGIDLKHLSFSENIARTSELCHDSILFEAGFLHERCYSRLDILIHSKGGFEIIEVKSSARVKDIHLEDLKFQCHVLSGLGMNVRKCSIMHINPNYVRHGDIELEKLFSLVDVTAEVNSLPTISDDVQRMIGIIDLPECPEFTIDDLLLPGDDPLAEEFLCNLPENSVFDLYKMEKEKAVSLWKKGVRLISDIPDDYPLSPKQRIQKESITRPHIDRAGIARFLSGLKYPIIHMDFEAFNPAIPLFDNSRPYQHIPFQYSLHIQHEDSVEHKEFLHNDDNDPRPEFIKSLLRDIPREGTILSFYKNYEIGRLNEIARDYPEYAGDIEGIKRRVEDLIMPFRSFYYYDSRQQGSCSIKAILPIFSEINHSALAIRDGGQAMLEYKNNRGRMSPEMRRQLLEYCKMDTEGMVMIVQGLKRLI